MPADWLIAVGYSNLGDKAIVMQRRASFFFFYNCIVPMGFLPWGIRVVFDRESQLRQSRAMQPRVHAG